jgi:hypothetical protein
MTARCKGASSPTSEAASCRCPPGSGQTSPPLPPCRECLQNTPLPSPLPLSRPRSKVALAHPADVVPSKFYSSSPSARRNLKPSPIAAPPSHNTQCPATTELPSLQPAAPVTTASQESPGSAQPPLTPTSSRKRKSVTLNQPPDNMSTSTGDAEAQTSSAAPQVADVDTSVPEPKLKKSRTNTPWTPAEELRLKQMRDLGNTWSEIAKVEICANHAQETFLA